MRSYLGVAEKEGISDDEIGAAEAIAMAVSAGRVRAQFRDIVAEHREPAESS